MTIERMRDQSTIKIQYGRHLQVVRDLESLPYCSRNQSAAFVTSPPMLVVWEDDPKSLLELAQSIETALVKIMWGGSLIHADDDEKDMDGDADSFLDLEHKAEYRRVELFQAIYTSMGILMLISAIGSGWRQVAIEQVQEPNWLRLLFLLTIPGQVWLSLVST